MLTLLHSLSLVNKVRLYLFQSSNHMQSKIFFLLFYFFHAPDWVFKENTPNLLNQGNIHFVNSFYSSCKKEYIEMTWKLYFLFAIMLVMLYSIFLIIKKKKITKIVNFFLTPTFFLIRKKIMKIINFF